MSKSSSRTVKSIAEITVVLLPLYVGIWVSAWLNLDHIQLPGGIVIAGGWPQPLGLAVSLLFLYLHSRRNGLTWSDFGIRRPGSWIKTILFGVLISGIVFVSVAFVINPTIRIVFPETARDLTRFDYLYQDLPNLIIQLVLIWITAAILEELLWRGFIIEKLLKKDTRPGFLRIFTVLLISSFIFGLAHLYQGPVGVLKTGSIGLVFGACYFLTGRNLLPLMIAHGLIDTIDMINHYLGK